METCNIFCGRRFHRSGARNCSYSIKDAPYLKDERCVQKKSWYKSALFCIRVLDGLSLYVI